MREATLPQHEGRRQGKVRPMISDTTEGTLRRASVGGGHMVLARVTHIIRHSNRAERHTHAEGTAVASKTGSHSPNLEEMSSRTLSSLEISRVTSGLTPG